VQPKNSPEYTKAPRSGQQREGFDEHSIDAPNSTTSPTDRKRSFRATPAALPFAGRAQQEPKPQRITNRPLVTLAEKCCAACGRGYVVAWAFLAVLLPGLCAFDLCAACSRELRYSEGEERERIAAEMIAAAREEGTWS
jgi:hypothetical protein